MTWIRHPGFRRLGRLADGECAPEEARRIREHLAECSRCREEFSFLQSLEHSLREISSPRPPPGMLEEALARRDAGERRILPVEDPPPVPGRRAGALAVAAFAVIAAGVGAFLLLTTGEVAAGSSELRIPPDALSALAPLPVEYRAASGLASEERLRLRVRYRYAGDPLPRLTLGRASHAELERTAPGRFEGHLRLPPAAVYAAFSLEELEGRDVDANGGRFWEAFARDETGQPTFAALEERLRVMNHVRPELAVETAVRLTELYPERIDAWAYRLFYQGAFLDREDRDSLHAEHRWRFAAFEREVAGATAVSTDELASLVLYARTLGDEEALRRWTERLEEVAPTHRFAVQERVIAIQRAHPGDPTLRLRRLEEEWKRSGPADESLLRRGFAAARDAGDPNSMLVWAERIDRYVPHYSAGVARDLAERPALRANGMERLRHELRRIEASGPDARPLDHSLPERRAETRRESAPLLAALGRALLADGDTAAALDTLSLAARRTWDPDLFRFLADVRLAAADTAGTIRLRALAAADPLQDPKASAALRLGPGPQVGEGAWRERLVEAHAELRRRARDASVSRPVPPELRVVDMTGAERRLEDLLDGPPTLLVYWAYLRNRPDEDLRHLRAAAEAWESAGARVLVVTARERTEELDALVRDPDLGLPVVFDEHGEVGRRLELLGRIRYLVIDGADRIRFRHREVPQALRHLLLLSEAAPSMSSPERTGLGPAVEGGATGIVTDHSNMGGNDAVHFENHASRVSGGGAGDGPPGDLERRDSPDQRMRRVGKLRGGGGVDVRGERAGGLQRTLHQAVAEE